MSSYIDLIRTKYATNYIDPSGVENMCIDLNILTETVMRKKHNNLYKAVWDEITGYLKIHPNLKSVFIASRGIVSTAELQQLRVKTFSTAKVSDLDPNSINPGTKFMSTLENTIRNYLSNNKQILPQYTTFSDSTIPGSVSDKIRDNIESSTICYSVDVHTIFTLLRLDLPFLFADFSNVVLPISSISEAARKAIGDDKWKSILFMMYCVTERFIPRIAAFANPTTTFNIIVEQIEKTPLIEDNKVLWKNAIRLFGHLSLKERTLLISSSTMSTLYDKALVLGDFNYNKYRKLYYDNNDVEIMVENYLELLALSWNNDKEDVNMALYYRFNIAPLLGDIFSIGKTRIVNIIKTAIWREESVTPSRLSQLVQVLPSSSFDLLPISLVKEIRRNPLLLGSANSKVDKITEMRSLKEPLLKLTKNNARDYEQFQDDEIQPNLFIMTNKATLTIPDSWSVYFF